MAERVTPPFNPGRLLVGTDTTALELSRAAGDVTLTAGSGSVLRRVGRAVTVDSLFADPQETCHLFRPGAVAAATLGTWKNTTRQQTVYLRKLLANLLTPQTTADAANCYRLKVTDSLAATAVLPFSSVTGTFLLDQGVGTVLDKGLNSHSGTGFSGAWQSVGGNAFGFTVAAQQTLTGLVVEQGLSILGVGAGGSFGVGSAAVRGSILDSSGNVLATGYGPTLAGNVINSARYAIPFTTSVKVVPGQTYYMAWDIFDTYPAVTGAAAGNNYAALLCYISDTQGGAANPGVMDCSNAKDQRSVKFTGVPGGVGSTSASRQTIMGALSWPALFANTAVMAANMVYLAGAGQAGNPRNFSWQMQGPPANVTPFSGDLVFSIDTVGAPIGTAAGTDLNVHALLTVS